MQFGYQACSKKYRGGVGGMRGVDLSYGLNMIIFFLILHSWKYWIYNQLNGAHCKLLVNKYTKLEIQLRYCIPTKRRISKYELYWWSPKPMTKLKIGLICHMQIWRVIIRSLLSIID